MLGINLCAVICKQAIGGAVAIIVGAFLYNRPANVGNYRTSFGATTVQDSRIAVTGSSFVNCEAISCTGGPTLSERTLGTTSLGTTSVYGGALSVLHSPQVSTFRGTMLWPPQALKLAGFNLTLFIMSCNFFACSVFTNSMSVLPGNANGGGGAVHASSVAFERVSIQSSSFSSCSVTVAKAASGVPSNSSGGGISVEIPGGSNSSVISSSNIFWNCSAYGAGQSYPFMAVRGGGMAVWRASAVKVSNTTFSACIVAGASSVSVVSGGSGLSIVLVLLASLTTCSFDGAGGQDSSRTSAGLLVLSSSAAPSQIVIDSCSFSSTGNMSLNVACVDAATGFNSVACVQPGPAISASSSNISQLEPDVAAMSSFDFSSIGSMMMSLQQNVSVASSNSLIVCNSTQFAVFRRQSFGSIVYFCSPCPTLKVSLTSNIVLLEIASAASSISQCISLSSTTSTLSCPFGVNFCSTILNVTSGFWANFSEAGDTLNRAFRCPQGYCGCGSASSCLLNPPFSLGYRPDDALCNGNRRGVLCGGCKPNFTQSLDGVTCISNDECGINVGWTWAVTAIGYAAYAIYTVLTSLQEGDGLIQCLLFYGQMSSFASFQRPQTSFSGASPSSSDVSSWVARITQFESVASLYSRTCYGMDMGAYAVTAAQLSGPAIVLVLSVAITMVLKRAKTLMQLHDIDVEVSVSATISAVTLLLFSSVTTIVFKLITCNGDLHVIFIDGTESCQDAKWMGLVAVVSFLCIFPIMFAVALRWKHLPPEVLITVCSAYSDSKFYWGAVTLAFRLVMSIVYASAQQFSNISALVHSILCVAMLLLLTYQRPYRIASTYHFDLLCYFCLIIQFFLEAFVRSSESLGISPGTSNHYYSLLEFLYQVSIYLRCVRTESLFTLL